MADSIIPQEKEAYAYSKAQTDALIAQSTAVVSGSPTPSYPDSDVSAQGTTPCIYKKVGNVVYLRLSFKIENAQIGYVHRKIIDLNLPDNVKPTLSVEALLGNASGDGFTYATIDIWGKMTLYPQKTGTTYAIGTVTYIL